ncbi:hypothetical protein M9H77_22360 [Catharanthus roseus]|uniref:Uncharacterized protein n=1 Tax=Catharanthus roseus TaxID=4058 RepID=A0ACC0ARG7_CATRO|nr:hypothetical protein M9H77_22360 [Catharanthus roseus]
MEKDGSYEKIKDYQSKLERDKYNFYHDGGYGVNAYSGNNHGISNFSSYAKFYGYTSYDDYGVYERVNINYVEHSPADCYDFGEHSYDRGDTQLSIPSQGVSKVEHLKTSTSMVDQLPRIKELPQDKIEKSLQTHRIEKEECIETQKKKKIRVEEKERLAERLCISESISILSKESEYFECSKEKFSFKELKLSLELCVAYITLDGNMMVNLFTCELSLDVTHMFMCSSSYAYFDKQLLVSVARIIPSYHDLELLYDNLFFDLLVANFSSSCASMWSKIHILLGSFVENSYDERLSLFSLSLSDVFHAKLKGEFVENYIMNHLFFMLL